MLPSQLALALPRFSLISGRWSPSCDSLNDEVESTMAHLKKDDQSSDSQQIKAYHASVHTPDTEYALHAPAEHTLSSDNDVDIVHSSGWTLPPQRTNPSHYFRGHDDSD